ncbi:MAG: type II secretion system protein [Candidatus Omnitrophica bacterium]|nr:type II secretion system protein [Candidatus Omnitrophota bacterium]
MRMKKSFTLIELLVVLIIIGILASVSVPRYQLYIHKAKSAEAKTALRAFSDAIWVYHIETDIFPGERGEFGNPSIPIPVPSVIGVKMPPSRYWIYTYVAYGISPVGNVEATYKDGLDAVPVGAVYRYAIGFRKGSVQHPREIEQLIDNGWYRIYTAHVKTATGSDYDPSDWGK